MPNLETANRTNNSKCQLVKATPQTKERDSKAHPAVPWDPASSPWISKLFIRIIALSLTVVAIAASLRLEGDPTLPLVDMDWPPETVVPHDLVPPPKPPLPLETVDEFLFPSSWLLLLLLLWFPISHRKSHETQLRPKTAKHS